MKFMKVELNLCPVPVIVSVLNDMFGGNKSKFEWLRHVPILAIRCARILEQA